MSLHSAGSLTLRQVTAAHEILPVRIYSSRFLSHHKPSELYEQSANYEGKSQSLAVDEHRIAKCEASQTGKETNKQGKVRSKVRQEEQNKQEILEEGKAGIECRVKSKAKIALAPKAN